LELNAVNDLFWHTLKYKYALKWAHAAGAEQFLSVQVHVLEDVSPFCCFFSPAGWHAARTLQREGLAVTLAVPGQRAAKSWVPSPQQTPAAMLGTFRQQQLSSTKCLLV